MPNLQYDPAYANVALDFPHRVMVSDVHGVFHRPMWDWLKEQVGHAATETHMGRFTGGRWMYEGPGFRFARQEDAALFVLFWG